MPFSVGCPRCPSLVTEHRGVHTCIEHGVVAPLWRPDDVDYASFGEHLQRTGDLPTYLPWPLGPGWAVSDFARVAPADGPPDAAARATLTCTSGTSSLDGPVDVLIVTEEAGTGLGARVAGVPHVDPGVEIGEGRPTVRVRLDQHVVPLWPVSTSAADGDWDRSVVAGEAGGRWLWLVLRPASAMLLLRDDWILRDASQEGPHLVELPFGGPAPAW